MNPNPNPTETTRPDPVRTRTQRAAEQLEIEQWAVRGKSAQQIAALLAARHPEDTRDLVKVVQYELRKLEQQWRDHAAELRDAEKARALRELDEIRAEAWEGWERSKQPVTRRPVGRPAAAPAAEESGASSVRPESEVKPGRGLVQVSRDGDPAFLRVLLYAQERRAALLGLDAPVKAEVSGPEGAPVAGPVKEGPLTEEHMRAIIARHEERVKMGWCDSGLTNTELEQVALERERNGQAAEAGKIAPFPEGGARCP
jgi:hypothetical protein